MVKAVTDDQTVLLQQAAAQLSQAASNRAEREKILKTVEGTLSQLKIADFPDLAESPVVQGFLKAMGAKDLRPGEVKNPGTLAERSREWTWDDANRKFEKVTFTPNESLPITWNGVGPVYLKEDEEITLPRPFYDIYMEHRKARRQAEVNKRWMMGKSNEAPDPNWMTDAGAKMRAYTSPGVGYGMLGVGPIYTGGEALPETEEESTTTEQTNA